MNSNKQKERLLALKWLGWHIWMILGFETKKYILRKEHETLVLTKTGHIRIPNKKEKEKLYWEMKK